MNKTVKTCLTLSLSLLLSGMANAASYYDYAKVKKITPVYKYVMVGGPQERCYSVPTHTHANQDSTLVGVVVGAALGNLIGENTESTVAGAVIGGSIGHSAAHHRVHMRQHCEIEYKPTRKARKLKGYEVTYKYKGKRYQTFLKNHPGDKLKVRVKVSPAY